MIINCIAWYLADLALSSFMMQLRCVLLPLWYARALFQYPHHTVVHWVCTSVVLADLLFRASASYPALALVVGVQLMRPLLYRQLKQDPEVHALCATVVAVMITALYPVAWTAFALCAILMIR